MAILLSGPPKGLFTLLTVLRWLPEGSIARNATKRILDVFARSITRRSALPVASLTKMFYQKSGRRALPASLWRRSPRGLLRAFGSAKRRASLLACAPKEARWGQPATHACKSVVSVNRPKALGQHGKTGQNSHRLRTTSIFKVKLCAFYTFFVIGSAENAANGAKQRARRPRLTRVNERVGTWGRLFGRQTGAGPACDNGPPSRNARRVPSRREGPCTSGFSSGSTAARARVSR